MPTQFKVNQLAKDLGFKSKDIMDIGAEKGMDLKVQGALEPWQFDVLFETLTKNHQVKDIDRYIDGETSIPSRLPKKEEPPVPAVKPVSEEKSAQKDEKPAEKPVEKPSEKTTEKPAEKATEKPAEKQVSDKSEEKKSAVKKPEAEQPSSAEKHAPVPDKKQNPANMQNILNQQRMQAQMNGEKVSAPAPVKAPVRPQQQQQQRPQNAQAQRPQNNGQPQQQRPQNNNNGQFGQPRFQNNNGQNAGNRPQFGNGTQPQNRDNRFQQQRPQNNQRPQGQRFDGRGGFDKSDKDYVPSTPRETFKPQAIVRTQTPKGGDGQQKQRGATRIVDTRTSDIDLSKYDEKLDTFASEDNDKNIDSGESAKIKKAQAAARQQAANSGKMPTKQPFQKNGQKGQKKQQVPIKKAPLNVQIPDEIVVSDLAARLKVTAGEVVKKLVLMGVMANLNQVIDYDTAALVAEELGAIVTKEVVVTIEEKLFNEDQDKEEDLVERAPVVCVMGHVDHGKTSLLDAIRNTSVTSGEAGGITQHIGAYRVKAKGREITFLDTPGHEAFTAMRARGAQATDIAILVVAADDGIMPQTVEAINHAKAAGIDIIVAINKMDKPTANPDQIKNQLTKYDLVPEEWGGDTICVPVSALTHAGIDDLLENILLVADVKEYKANPNRRAKGIVIEAKLDKGRGPVATILVQNGTLKPGDIVIAGTAVGRVRAMTDHNGKTVKVAGPSVPVEITGLDAVPTAGDEFNGVENERMARELADRRRSSAKEENFKANARASLDDLFAQISDGVKSLNVIVKADVDGSVEAVKASLVKISNEEVKVSVIHAAVGGITEGDVMFAAASNAIIVGFNVRPDKQALDSAERQGVEIRTYRVIYECIDEITAAMKGMLAPKFRESLLGHVEVRQIFKISKVGVIAGSYVQDGKVTRAAKIRVVRDGIVISEDEIASLRREKDDVKEVMAGYECGIGLEKFKDIKVGDILEAYVMEEVQQ